MGGTWPVELVGTNTAESAAARGTKSTAKSPGLPVQPFDECVNAKVDDGADRSVGSCACYLISNTVRIRISVAVNLPGNAPVVNSFLDRRYACIDNRLGNLILTASAESWLIFHRALPGPGR